MQCYFGLIESVGKNFVGFYFIFYLLIPFLNILLQHLNEKQHLYLIVLLIHDNSAAMRQWLWVDTLKNAQMYTSSYFVIHAFGSVLGVFAVCTALDYLRIQLLEKPFFRLWDRHYEAIAGRFRALEHRICRRFHISDVEA